MRLAPHHVGIVVGDLARSKAFYGALGFTPGEERRAGDKTLSFMHLGDLAVEFFAYDEGLSAAESRERQLGFRHLAFECADFDATLAELKQRGLVPADARPLELPDGMRLLFFRDPDGMEIEIKQA